MFKVLNNGRPAKYPEFDMHPSWNNNEFNTKEEAIKYARNWCGLWAPTEFWDGSKVDYSGMGDYIEVIYEEKT